MPEEGKIICPRLNVKALQRVVSPKIEQWACSRYSSWLHEEHVLNVVSVTLKLAPVQPQCDLQRIYPLITFLQLPNVGCSDLWPPSNETFLLWEVKVPLISCCMRRKEKICHSAFMKSSIRTQNNPMFSFLFTSRYISTIQCLKLHTKKSSGRTAFMKVGVGNVNRTEWKL